MMIPRNTRRVIGAALVAAGIATPMQAKQAIYVPSAPAIIRPAKLWVPHEKKLIKQLAMPGMIGMQSRRSSTVLTPGWKGSYVDTVNGANKSFAGCALGTPHPTRMIVFCATANTDVDVTAATVDGTGATLVAAVTSGVHRRLSMWRAASTANSTGTIALTHGSENNAVISVYALYPASHTPVDAGALGNNSTSVTVTDIAKTNGGWTIIVSIGNHVTATMLLTQNGAETIVKDYEATIEATYDFTTAFHVNTATTTTDDYTSTFSGGVNSELALVVGSWF